MRFNKMKVLMLTVVITSIFLSGIIFLAGVSVTYAQGDPSMSFDLPATPANGGASLGGQGSINFGGVTTGPGVNTGGNAGGSGAPLPLNFVPLIKDYPQMQNMQNADIPSFLNTLFSITVGVAATLAILMVAVGGIEYMMTESPYKLGDAKERIGMAIFGLLIVLTSVLILRTINPQITSLQLFQPSASPPVLTPSQATTKAIQDGKATATPSTWDTVVGAAQSAWDYVVRQFTTPPAPSTSPTRSSAAPPTTPPPTTPTPAP